MGLTRVASGCKYRRDRVTMQTVKELFSEYDTRKALMVRSAQGSDRTFKYVDDETFKSNKGYSNVHVMPVIEAKTLWYSRGCHEKLAQVISIDSCNSKGQEYTLPFITYKYLTAKADEWEFGEVKKLEIEKFVKGTRPLTKISWVGNKVKAVPEEETVNGEWQVNAVSEHTVSKRNYAGWKSSKVHACISLNRGTEVAQLFFSKHGAQPLDKWSAKASA